MKINGMTKDKAVQRVIACLGKEPGLSRDALIERVLSLCGITEEDKKDLSPAGKFNLYRSYIGLTVDALHAKGDLTCQEGQYALAKDALVIVQEGACEKAILRLLTTESLPRKTIYERLDERFGTKRTRSQIDDNALHAMAGNILARLEKEGMLTVKNGVYRLKPKAPPTPVTEREAFQKEYLQKLHAMGGEFFERYTVSLLERYYLLTGRRVLLCEVLGGADDGGIDGRIDTEDELGFFERVMIQTKCREKNHVTEKEVREFYGAVCAQNGTRGIYVTTSVFHPGAERLLASIENCVGIDKDKLFELALKTSYGIRLSKEGYRFDNSLF